LISSNVSVVFSRRGTKTFSIEKSKNTHCKAMLIASILEVFSIISFYSVANLNSEEQFPTSELSCIIYQTNQKSSVIPLVANLE